MHTPVVSVEWLRDHLNDPDLIIADVRWYIGIYRGGWDAYLRGRIPGAVYVDLDDDLSDRSDPKRGRHPLPRPDQLVETLARIGIGRDHVIVAYDDNGGSIAARLWWMLRWLGHDRAALLDGGFPAWVAANPAIQSGEPTPRKRATNPFVPKVRNDLLATQADAEQAAEYGTILLDARPPERFRGEIEPVDFKAGHIPDAQNRPWSNNLSHDSPPHFLAPIELQTQFSQLGLEPDSSVICYCGSGVTACHNVLALELAGFKNVRLYAGSWSEWIHHH